MASPPAVLFDIDGTLASFDGIGKAAMSRAMEEIWGIPDALFDFSFAGATDGGAAARAAPGRERDAMWVRYVEHLQAALVDGHPPLPGVTALLDRLSATVARAGLLTGNLRAGAAIKLQSAGLHGYFDFDLSAFADDDDARTGIATAARRRCGDAPITVVGDTVADIECARHIGARVLAVASGFGERAHLEAARPDLLVDDLSETDAVCGWLLGRR